jgi:hypothetical protein
MFSPRKGDPDDTYWQFVFWTGPRGERPRRSLYTCQNFIGVAMHVGTITRFEQRFMITPLATRSSTHTKIICPSTNTNSWKSIPNNLTVRITMGR